MNSSNPKEYYSNKELANMSLHCLPQTVQGINHKAKKEGWFFRSKKGFGGGVEYKFNSLPQYVKKAIKLKLLTNSPIKQTKKIDVIRQCPPLLENKTDELNDNQRKIADARCVVVTAVLQLESIGIPRYKAVQEISTQSRNNALSIELSHYVKIANAKKGNRTGVGARVLNEWVLNFVKAKNAAERLYLLAPGQNKVKPADSIKWLPDYLAIYRDPRGESMKSAYRKFCKLWAEKYEGNCPSYDAIRRAMDKLPVVVKEKYRVTGSAWRSLNPYIQRDWSQIPVNGVWVGDGHNLKMDVAHPDHGRPFSPEITLILDSRTRYVVGWSLSLSENAIAVADALRYAMETNGRPLIYYSDNGGGQTNKKLDADVTGILTRLCVEHRTGIPGNPQGRGIIERLNKVIPNAIARRFVTYHGAGADNETVRKTKRGIQSAFNAFTQGKELSNEQQKNLNRLPSWNQLIEVIAEEIEKYNNEHEHRSLPKKGNGKHFTPAEYRQYLIEFENHEVDYLSNVELKDMFRPEIERVVSRGQIQLFNNIYFAIELTNYHKDTVRVTYDIHNPNAVIVRNMNGEIICKAVWDGNKRDAFPKPVIDHIKEKRVKGMVDRAQSKINAAMAELSPVIESNANALDFSQVLNGNIENQHYDDEPLFLTEADKQRYENHKKKAVNS